jgi:hypothetical protein
MKMISNIVFTKNRPLQMEAYLESLYRYFPAEIIQTYVIYKVELFDEQYELLFKKFPDYIVIKESDFHSDFMNMLSQINTKYILFGVDDVIYFESVDFNVIDETFNEFSGDIFGFSLRFGAESIKSNNEPISEANVANQTIHRLNWTQGRTPTTRYPFELCATVYSTALVKKIINSSMSNNLLLKKLFLPGSTLTGILGKSKLKRKILKSFGYFYNPNTLESWNCRWCQNHKKQLPANLYFQNFCASAVQVNIVNINEREKYEDLDEYTAETLAEKYKQGYRLDIDYIARNRPMGTHSTKQHFRLVKKF